MAETRCCRRTQWSLSILRLRDNNAERGAHQNGKNGIRYSCIGRQDGIRYSCIGRQEVTMATQGLSIRL